MQIFHLRRWVRSAIVLFFIGLGLAATAQAAPDKQRVNIIYKHGAKANVMSAIAGSKGQVIYEFDFANATTAVLPAKAVRALKKNKNIRIVEPDYEQHAVAITSPSTGDPYLLGQQVPYGIPMVQADSMPNHDAFAANRTLCVIDSGVDGNHEDLAGNQMAGENLTTSGAWNTDEYDHGTHVTGTIAAINNLDTGVVGVMPNQSINLYFAKVFDASGSANASTVAQAMWHCYSNGGANVISMSLGGTGRSFLQAIVAAILDRRGVLMVAAAGNAGNSSISYPAGYPGVMSVAAIDQSKNRASFSQYNDTVEISGPGVSVMSTLPGDTYGAFSGTSMATPHVSAVAALVWSYFPSCSNGQVRDALDAGAEDLSIAGRDNFTGYGLVQAVAAYNELLATGC